MNGMSASSLLVEVCASQSPYWNGMKPARLFHITLRKAVGRNSQIETFLILWTHCPYHVGRNGGVSGSFSPNRPVIYHLNLPITTSISINQTMFLKKRYLQCWRIRHKLSHKAKIISPNLFFKTGSVKKAALEVLFDILIMPQTLHGRRVLLRLGDEVHCCQHTGVKRLTEIL